MTVARSTLPGTGLPRASFTLTLGMTLLLAMPAEAQDPVPSTSGTGVAAAPAVPLPSEDVLELLRSGIPSGELVSTPIDLSLSEAIARALSSNLAILVGESKRDVAAAERQAEHGQLLPRLDLGLLYTRSEFNLDASPFRDFGPSDEMGPQGVIGPFNVFDARLRLQAPLYDPAAWSDWRAKKAAAESEQHEYEERRVLTILAIGNLYLGVLTEQGRVEAATAQLQTATSLFELAQSRNQAGLAPGIEVLRSEVQLQAQRQRKIAASNQLTKARLNLARAIGLPLGQTFRLTDALGYEPLRDLTPEVAIAQAYQQRKDLRSSEAELRRAELEVRSAGRERWPALFAAFDFGYIGADVSSAKHTFGLGAYVRMPLFDRAETGKRAEARLVADLSSTRLTELRARIHYQVLAALLDVKAADELVRVAERAREVSDAQLVQAQNRFEAGISSNLEIVRAQEDIARATEWYLNSLLRHRNAKGALARAMGISETALVDYLAGATDGQTTGPQP